MFIKHYILNTKLIGNMDRKIKGILINRPKQSRLELTVARAEHGAVGRPVQGFGSFTPRVRPAVRSIIVLLDCLGLFSESPVTSVLFFIKKLETFKYE